MNLAIGPRSAAVPRPPYALAVLMMLQSSWAQPPYTLAVLTALQSSWAPRPYDLPDLVPHLLWLYMIM
jgi:hypothetical protein